MSTQIDNIAVRWSAWLGRVEVARAKVKSLAETYSKAQDELRSLESAKEYDAPFVCEVCGRGVWQEEGPHVHTNVFSRKKPQTKFKARMVERPNAKLCDAGEKN